MCLGWTGKNRNATDEPQVRLRFYGYLRPTLPQPIRVLVDVHLGRLATYLRLLGFDAVYSPDLDDAQLALIAETQARC